MTQRARSDAGARSTTPKIVVQYRQKSANVYEFESNGAALELRICPVGSDSVTSEWRVGAQSRSEHAVPVERTGATPAEALSEVARAWKAHLPELMRFDWEAIARELHVVHAI